MTQAEATKQFKQACPNHDGLFSFSQSKQLWYGLIVPPIKIEHAKESGSAFAHPELEVLMNGMIAAIKESQNFTS